MFHSERNIPGRRRRRQRHSFGILANPPTLYKPPPYLCDIRSRPQVPGGDDSTSRQSKPRMRKSCTRDHPLLPDATTSLSHAAAFCPAETRAPASSDEASHVSEVQSRRSTKYPLRISHHSTAPNSKLVSSQDKWVYLRNFVHRNSRSFSPQFLIFTSSRFSCCWKR